MTSPRTDILAFLLEDTSPDSLDELDDRIDREAVLLVAARLISASADEDAAGREALSAVRRFCRMDADATVAKETPATELRQALKEASDATDTLLALYGGASGGGQRAVRILGKVLANRSVQDGTEGGAKSPSAVVRTLETTKRSLEHVLAHMPAGRWPHVLQARFVANEAGRFQRLTGIAPTKTSDPLADSDRMTGPFAEYLREIEGAADVGRTLSETDIRSGIDLWRAQADVTRIAPANP